MTTGRNSQSPVVAAWEMNRALSCLYQTWWRKLQAGLLLQRKRGELCELHGIALERCLLWRAA